MKQFYLKILTKIHAFCERQIVENFGLDVDYRRYRGQRYYWRSRLKFDVTDHALIRYFERMEDYNLREVRQTITNGLKEKNGFSKQFVADMVVVCKDNTILTVYPQEPTANRFKIKKGGENAR